MAYSGLNFMKQKFIRRLSLALLLSAGLRLEATTNRPNIVFILGDDIGWADVGRYHEYYTTNTTAPLPTPNLNRLCDEGMMFTDAQLPASLCAPNRFCLLTGNYPWRSRLGGSWNATGSSAFFFGAAEDDRSNNPHRTIGQVLQAAGYRTAYFGKMHFGSDFFDTNGNRLRNLNATNNAQIDFSRAFTNGMRDHGFDYTFVNPSGIQGPLYAWFENDHYRPISDFQSEVDGVIDGPASTLRIFLKKQTVGDGEIIDDGYGDSRFDTSDHGPILSHFASKFIGDHVTNHPGQPFMIYYATPAIHVPITPSTDGYVAAGSTGLGDRADFIADLDMQVGRILATLDQLGVASNTIVIFTGDNGGWFLDTDPQVLGGQPPCGPLRGKKSSIYEGGHREPFIWRWGDGSTNHSVIPPGQVCTQLVSPIDWVPSIIHLVGQTVSVDQHQDSLDMLSLLLTNNPDAQPATRDRVLHQLADGSQAVRLNDAFGQWFYLRPNSPAPMELYNLATDFSEVTNLVEGYTNIASLPSGHPHKARIEEMEAWFLAHDTTYEARTTPAFNYAAGVAAPMNLNAAGTGTEIVLNWSAALGATGYNLKRAPISGGSYTIIASNITATTYTNTGVVAGTAYYYVVSGTNAAGESANSSEAGNLSALFLWRGDSNGRWDMATNWVGGAAPNSADTNDVIFYATSAGNLTNYLKAAQTLRSLHFTNFAAGDIEIQQTTTLGGTTAAIMTMDGYGAGATITVDAGVVANINLGGGAGNTKLNDNLTITHNGSGLLTFNRQFTSGANGAKTITKEGNGVMTWSGSSGFTGGTILNAGTLNISSATALGKGPLTINGGKIDNTSTNGTVTVGNTNAFFWNTSFTYLGTKWLNLGTGDVTLGDDLTVTTTAGKLTVGGPVAGDFTLTKSGGGAIQLNSSGSTYSGGTVQNGSGNLILGTNNALGSGTLTLSNSSGAILSSGAAARTLTNAIVFAAGQTLGDSSSTGELTFSGPIEILGAQRTLTVKSDVILSGDISGSGGITKANTGKLTLAGNNTCTLGTTISAGTLLVNGSLGTNTVAVNGGTLGGCGTIHGAVTVATNATLQPGLGGTDSSPLTISNQLILAAGSTTLIAINSTNASTASALTGITAQNYGGMLLVTNLGPALAGGEIFTLFSAASYNGAFTATNLPPLASGLKWVWAPGSGTLAVVDMLAASTPTNISFSASGTNLTLTWPASHLGWVAQSNAAHLADSNYWFDIAGTINATSLNIPINSAVTNVFFRLRQP